MIKGRVTFTYSDGAKTAISLFQCLKGHYRVSNDGQILRPISYTLLLGPGTLTVAEAVRLSTWLNQIPLVISG